MQKIIKNESPNLGQVLLTGSLGIVTVLAIAALIIWSFEHHMFTEWVGTAFIAATPTQIIIGLLWHNGKPEFANRFSTPVKGLILTLITIIAGAIFFAGMLFFVGGGHGISPMLIQYAIMTVVVTIWMVPIWQCWPATLLTKDPFKFGIIALLLSYVIAYVLWQLFFDYAMLAKIGHPAYHADIDPQGIFDMWLATTYFVTTAGVIVVHTLFDFWPVNKLAKSAVQPLRGIIATLYILALSWLIRTIFVDGIGLDQVDFMVRGPVCMIFGTFLVNNMMQFQLFTKLAQPVKGLVLLACAIVAALIMHELYVLASSLHTGSDLITGPSRGYARELWIASAMLGVTFPIVFVVSGFFNFWPIRRK